jgi:hypothetical protein
MLRKIAAEEALLRTVFRQPLRELLPKNGKGAPGIYYVYSSDGVLQPRRRDANVSFQNELGCIALPLVPPVRYPEVPDGPHRYKSALEPNQIWLLEK